MRWFLSFGITNEKQKMMISIWDKFRFELTHVEEDGNLIRYYEADMVVTRVNEYDKVIESVRIPFRCNIAFFREWHKGFHPSIECKDFFVKSYFNFLRSEKRKEFLVQKNKKK